MNNTDLVSVKAADRADTNLWNVFDTEYHYKLISKLMQMGIDEPL